MSSETVTSSISDTLPSPGCPFPKHILSSRARRNQSAAKQYLQTTGSKLKLPPSVFLPVCINMESVLHISKPSLARLISLRIVSSDVALGSFYPFLKTEKTGYVLRKMGEMSYYQNLVTVDPILYHYLKTKKKPKHPSRMSENIKKSTSNSDKLCLKRAPMEKPKRASCNALICMLCKLGLLTEAEVLMQCMNKLGVTIDMVTFNCIINSFCEMGDTSKAFSYCDEMVRCGHIPGSSTYASLLKGLCGGNNSLQPNDFLNELGLIHAGFKINICAYNILLAKFCKVGDLDGAGRLCDLMVEKNLEPDLHTYTTIISGLMRQGKVVSSIMFFHQMELQELPPDHVSYTCLINGLVKKGLFKTASHFSCEMMECKEIFPDIIAFNAAIESYIKAGKVETAENLIQIMEKRRIHPNVNTYTMLIKSYIKRKELLKSLALYKVMLRKGIKPDRVTYHCIICGLCEGNMVDIALKFLEKLVMKGILPNYLTFNLLLAELSKKNQIDHALRLLSYMKLLHLLPSRDAYDAIIYGLNRKNNFHQSYLVLHDMMNMRYEPKVTHYISLINWKCRVGNIKGALGLKDEMVTLGLVPRNVAESTIIRSLCKCGRLEESMLVFNNLIREGTIPTIGTFATLMHGLCIEARLEDALCLKTMLHNCGLKSDTVIYNILIKGLCANGELTDAFELYEEMKIAGLLPNVTTYSVLVDAICLGRRFLEGEKILGDVLKRGLVSVENNSKDLGTAFQNVMTRLNDVRKCQNLRSSKFRKLMLSYIVQRSVP